ncbi:hypothetical protein ABPG72_004141 [Tetrahymena utriculariae]
MDKVEVPHVNANGNIYFYREYEHNGIFSNFYASPITLKEKQWPTTEHYFQAQKFSGTEKEELIRLASTPNESFKLGRQTDDEYPLRKDWQSVKDEVMYEALKAKFTQHKDLKKFLLSTGDAKLIEHTQKDKYWADGGDGSGKNMLGILLMNLRKELKEKTI